MGLRFKGENIAVPAPRGTGFLSKNSGEHNSERNEILEAYPEVRKQALRKTCGNRQPMIVPA